MIGNEPMMPPEALASALIAAILPQHLLAVAQDTGQVAGRFRQVAAGARL